MSTEILAGETYRAVVSAFDAHRNPTTLPGTVAWSSLTFSTTAQPDGGCLFMVESIGKHILSARSGNAAADVELIVLPGPAAYLDVAIVPFDLEKGERGR